MMGDLVRFIEAHGVEAAVDDGGQLRALAQFTYKHPSGEVMVGSAWEPIEATPAAVRAWLGY